MTNRVFVYGTLKRGMSNHHLLERSQYVGEAFTLDSFRMYSVGFPVIRFRYDGKPVFGEVYDVSDEALADLDRLENEGTMYDRKQINVMLADGPDVIDANVHVYVGNDDRWDWSTMTEYGDVNVHDELEWRP